MLSKGFSLIELLVAMSVLAIVLGMAVPNFGSILESHRIASIADGLVQGLMTARMEAVKRNTTVTFQQNGAGWNISANGAVILSKAVVSTQVLTPADVQIRFTSDGRVITGSTSIAITSASHACGSISCINVAVTSGGSIKSCRPAAASGAVDAC